MVGMDTEEDGDEEHQQEGGQVPAFAVRIYPIYLLLDSAMLT